MDLNDIFCIFLLNFFINFSVELAVWTHSVANDIKPELLKDMPDLEKLQHVVIGGTNGTTDSHPADSITNNSDESNSAPENLADNHKNDEQKETTKQKPANGTLKEKNWQFLKKKIF